jgi:hypothetical protein
MLAPAPQILFGLGEEGGEPIFSTGSWPQVSAASPQSSSANIQGVRRTDEGGALGSPVAVSRNAEVASGRARSYADRKDSSEAGNARREQGVALAAGSALRRTQVPTPAPRWRFRPRFLLRGTQARDRAGWTRSRDLGSKGSSTVARPGVERHPRRAHEERNGDARSRHCLRNHSMGDRAGDRAARLNRDLIPSSPPSSVLRTPSPSARNRGGRRRVNTIVRGSTKRKATGLRTQELRTEELRNSGLRSRYAVRRSRDSAPSAPRSRPRRARRTALRRSSRGGGRVRGGTG